MEDLTARNNSGDVDTGSFLGARGVCRVKNAKRQDMVGSCLTWRIEESCCDSSKKKKEESC
jgi:hypothetical protein